MNTEHAYRILRDIAGETTKTIVGADRPLIDAAREALDLAPLAEGEDVAVGLDLERATYVIDAVERGGNPESEECYDSSCPGFFAEAESQVDGRRQAFGVARCDACARYPGDVEAAHAYVLARWESGYVLTAWNGEHLGTGSDSVSAFTHWIDAVAFADELIRMHTEEVVNGVYVERAYCSAVRIEMVAAAVAS